jgi:hypothetical protein
MKSCCLCIDAQDCDKCEVQYVAYPSSPRFGFRGREDDYRFGHSASRGGCSFQTNVAPSPVHMHLHLKLYTWAIASISILALSPPGSFPA